MRATLVLFTLAGFLTVSTAHCQTSDRFTPTPGLVLTIRAVQDTIKAGSPVQLMVILANKSKKDIRVMMSGSGAENTYRVEVRDEKGNLPPDTRLGIRRNGRVDPKDFERLGFTEGEILNSGSTVNYLLKPGESFTQSLTVTALYDMSKPGKYKIGITKEKDEDDGIFVQSNTVTVIVTP